MKILTKYQILIIIIILLNSSCSNREEGSLKIGALLPMTGSGALYGKYAQQGMQVAIDEINDNGGINGKRLKLVVEDSRSNPKDGVSAFNSLIQRDVKAVLAEFSPVVIACSPLANESKTVLLNCGAQNPKIRESGPFVFSIIIDANTEAKKMAEFLFDSLKIKEVGTYVINTDTGVDTESEFVSTYEKLGGRVLIREVHNQGITDFRSTLTKIKATNPPAVYLVSLVKESAQIIKQASELGFNPQWLSYASFQGPDIINIAGKSAEGTIYTYPTFNESTKLAEDFINNYKNKYDTEPEIYASTFYDGLKIIASAYSKGHFNSEAIKEFLKNIKYKGVTGITEFTVGNGVDKPAEFRVVRDGTFERY